MYYRKLRALKSAVADARNASTAFAHALTVLHHAVEDMPQFPMPGSPEIPWDELPVRAVNCLKSEALFTLDHLCTYSRQELRQIPNMGRLTCDQVEAMLVRRNMALRRDQC